MAKPGTRAAARAANSWADSHAATEPAETTNDTSDSSSTDAAPAWSGPSFGFRSAGVRRRYYQDNGEDARIMWRTPATLRGTLEDVPGTRAGAL